MLEMLALMILRRREPELERPFKIPGGMPVLVLMLVLPMVLIGLLSFTTVREEGWLKQLPSVVAIFLGIVVYRVATTRQSRLQSAEDR
jgi:amino acid transporter